MLLNIFDTTLPVSDPVLKYLIVILIVLLTPILLNKVRIPHLIGLIIAGAIIGPNGIHLLDRDSSIVVSGTTGLLYIMFLAGLEIDLVEFKKNRHKSLIFGLFTFLVPMSLGIMAGRWLLGYEWMTSILLASLFASHTLLAYPIVSKLGVAKDRAVNIAVGGTMITDTLALLVLAVIVGMTKGVVDAAFWIRLTLSILLFGLIVLVGFPIIGRWFFKKVDDKISQFIFVIVMLYLGAVLAEMAGVEAIIGAFLAGLALNKLIPHTSPLMNRVDFVGNALFIPFFLISVGMLIDYRAFIKDMETLKVATVMTLVALTAKLFAAWLTAQSFRFSKDQLRVVFGLSAAQAAATLAAVLVGYNIIIAETPNGEPIRLLSESVLNGSILMILITCTVASLVTQKGASNLAAQQQHAPTTDEESATEKILIALSRAEHTEHLVQLALNLKSPKSTHEICALHVVNQQETPDESDREAKKLTALAQQTAAAADVPLKDIVRFDHSVTHGIAGEIKAHKITDLILGYSAQAHDEFKQKKWLEEILANEQVTTYIYHPAQPLSTLQRCVLVIPPGADRETGFLHWLIKVWELAKQAGAALHIFAAPELQPIIERLHDQTAGAYVFEPFMDWEDVLILSREVRKDDLLVMVMSRPQGYSYHDFMPKMFRYLDKYFRSGNFLLIYPIQAPLHADDAFYVQENTLLNPALDVEHLFGKR